MELNKLKPATGARKTRKRVGRGRGSGVGKTSGRGHKGARSRSGFSARIQFEGGQTPYFRRIKKTGFTNANFKTHFWTVNLSEILDHEAFAKGGEITEAKLIEAGLVRDDSRPVKILGDLGEHADKGVGAKFDITVSRVTKSVREKVTGAGGSVKELGSRRDNTRGIDRNSDDLTPKNLTKKLKKQEWHRKRDEAFARGEVLKKK